MIYTSTGVQTNKMSKVAEDAWEYLVNYSPKTFKSDSLESLKDIKAKEAQYFLAGELTGVRNNSNLKSKDLLAIDYDEINLSPDDFISRISNKLKGYAFRLYPTISSGFPGKGNRMRLVIRTNRSYNENEFEILKDSVPTFVGIAWDKSAMKYSQLAGLPVVTPYTDKSLFVTNNGKPLIIEEFIKGNGIKQEDLNSDDVLDQLNYNLASDEGLTPNEALSLVNAYVEKVGDKLNDRDYFLAPYQAIRSATQRGVIETNTAHKALTMLARGNVEWAADNIAHFDKDTTRVRGSYTLRGFFGWAYDKQANSEKTEPGSLRERIKNLRNEELLNLLKAWESNGKRGRKPSVIPPAKCAILLSKCLDFCLFDSNENTRLATYIEKEGLWTQNETYLRRFISWLEPTLNKTRASDVIYHLRNKAPIKRKTQSRYLIPVNNGVFNLRTHSLESYSSDYVFTSKIATDYVENAESPNIDGWTVDKWLNEVACNDQQIVTLLWQVISDAMNSSFSRRTSIWLVGNGSNGKGTYQELITSLVGIDNIAPLKVNQFDERFTLAMLEEKVCCIGDDVADGLYIDDSSNFNSVITGEPVMIERKGVQNYIARFSLTVLQSTNGMPKIKNKSDGTYRRITIVPFNASFEGSKDNWNIKDDYIKRKEVLQYVLNKAINLDFEEFSIPEVSIEMKEEYRMANDPIADFKVNVFDELSIRRAPVAFLYELYKEFCVTNGYRSTSLIKFSRSLDHMLGAKWEKKTFKLTKSDLNELTQHDPNGIFASYDSTSAIKGYENRNLASLPDTG